MHQAFIVSDDRGRRCLPYRDTRLHSESLSGRRNGKTQSACHEMNGYGVALSFVVWEESRMELGITYERRRALECLTERQVQRMGQKI
jgi:hypothetical protein